MAPKFGTSGLRGLVTDLTDDFVARYTRAFLAACPSGGAVYVGWDLRPSSPRIAQAVIRAASDTGLPVMYLGEVPTPALALAAQAAGAAAIMVTGSHIPADRNGLKFYVPGGEISKDDEAGITTALDAPAPKAAAGRVTKADAGATYVTRYTQAFGPGALTGLRIGVYQHSSVARDPLVQVVEALGGTAVPLARSDIFIPVDTEAVDPETRTTLAGWCRDQGLDAVVSTDGDADRPMVTDATGRIVPGDILGPLTAQALKADVIVTPVSSNTAVDAMGFANVMRTRIGSPFVIAGMEQHAGARVVGYEANGGFLLGFTAQGPADALPPLMTRDSVLPIVAPLMLARARGQSLAELVATLPPRFTAADRITGVAPEVSVAFLARMSDDAAFRAAFFAQMGSETQVDLTDGLRVTFDSGEIVHLRPSGNAPEFRCYAEAATSDRAEDLLRNNLNRLTSALA